MGKPLDHCVTIVSSKPNNRAWSSGLSRLYVHTTEGAPIPAYNRARSSGLACTRTLPDTMVKGTPIIPLRKEFTNFVLRFGQKGELCIWKRKIVLNYGPWHGHLLNYCILNLLYYGQKDRYGQLMMTLDEIYVCNSKKKKSFQNGIIIFS